MSPIGHVSIIRSNKQSQAFDSIGLRGSTTRREHRMKRIVVFGQTGSKGRLSCAGFADRLARRLGLARRAEGPDGRATDTAGDGWVAVESAGHFSEDLFRAADTAIWLHYLPLAVAREWLAGLRNQVVGAGRAVSASRPRLVDLRDSLLHMAQTPHVYRSLRHPALAHLHVHHLRNPDEAEFWLRTQALRLPPAGSSMQPA